MERNVTIVVVTHGSARFLPRCFESIRRLDGITKEIIVVDNASTDDSLQLASTLLPEAIVVSNETNRGFAPAVNQAIARSSGEFVLLLNPDCRLEPAYVRALIEALESEGPGFGAATGKLLRAVGENLEATNIIDSKGIRMTRNGRHLDIDAGEQDREDDERVREVFGVSGAAALFRRTMLEAVAVDGEVLDEDFFTWREDADLAWRSRLFGWRALYVPAAVGYHVRTVTPEKRQSISPVANYHSVKNRFLLRLKNQGAGLARRHFPFETFRDLLVIAACLTVERSSLPALFWLWQHRSRIMKKRAMVQGRRTVSDRALAVWFR